MGTRVRLALVGATFIPLLMHLDRAGFVRLGFTKQELKEEFKAKPDYVTETLFVGRRTDVPDFKEF